jgi:hypothetical protein
MTIVSVREIDTNTELWNHEIANIASAAEVGDRVGRETNGPEVYLVREVRKYPNRNEVYLLVTEVEP